MGGSGGRAFGRSRPDRFANRLGVAQDEDKRQAFGLEVSEVINDLLSVYNERDVASIQEHIATVKAALNKDSSVVDDLAFGGSVSKHTYVDGVSDVDALVYLNPDELGALSPSKVRKFFERRLKDRLPNTKIITGSLAVTLTFADGVVLQLVPVVRRGAEMSIPSESGKNWLRINPKVFVRDLRKANDALGGKLVPTIKLAKAIISGLPEDRRLTGYHAEALSLRAFAKYTGARTVKDLLQHFFRVAPSLVLQPIVDRTGQTQYVDEYLGAKGSYERELVADAVDRIGRRMRNADLALSVSLWREILEAP